MAFHLTAFADEISTDLGTQLDTLNRLNISSLDLRTVYGKNVSTLTDSEAQTANREITDAGVRIACIGSPVNKVPLEMTAHTAEMDKLKRCLEIAKLTDTPCLRLFTPETPEPRTSYTDQVIDWIAPMVELAERYQVILLHENDARYWGAYPDTATILFTKIQTPYFKAAFDFANTVLIGYRPMTDWFPWLLPHLHTLHIKDAVQAEGKVVPAGQGDGQLAETIRFLRQQGWNGPLTLEPHLAAAGQYGGYSGPELFTVAVDALRKVLNEVEA